MPITPIIISIWLFDLFKKKQVDISQVKVVVVCEIYDAIAFNDQLVYIDINEISVTNELVSLLQLFS
jgi:hypothetical protein